MKNAKQKSTAKFLTDVMVMGKRYTLEWLDDFQLCGECNPNKQHIKIQKGLAKEQEHDTVLHEVMHAIDYTMQTKMSERQISAMASGLIAVMKDNPKLMEYLLDSQGQS